MDKKTKKERIFLYICVTLILLLAGLWVFARFRAPVPAYPDIIWTEPDYTDTEITEKSMAASYFLYGYEHLDSPSGRVCNLIAQNSMWMLDENMEIRRTDETDPSTAVLDTKEWICRTIGSFRVLFDHSDPESGFYGVVYADDDRSCVWITYSGAMTPVDMRACLGLVFDPGLNRHESAAFALLDKALATEEVSQEGYSVLLSGHSLGGALSTIVSAVSGCPAININGANGVAVCKVRGLIGRKASFSQITNHLTRPDKGDHEFVDWIQRLMFLGKYKAVNYRIYPEGGLTTDPHCVFSCLKLDEDGNLCIPTPEEQYSSENP